MRTVGAMFKAVSQVVNGMVQVDGFDMARDGVVLAHRGLDREAQRRIAEHVASGGRVLLAFNARTAACIEEDLLPVRGAGPVLVADREEPLAAAREVRSVGGLLLEEPHAVRGEELDRAGGQVVLSWVGIGSGELLVLGSTGALRDTNLLENRRIVELIGAREPVREVRTSQDLSSIEVVQAAQWRVPACTGDLLEDAMRAVQGIDPEVFVALRAFRARPNGAGALLLRNVPVGEIGPTPERPTAPSVKDRVSETVLLSVAFALGEPVGYAPEHGGDVVQNILPTKTATDRQVSTSSKVELLFHTEAAFHPHKPRWLLLLCLRGDEAAATTLAGAHDVVGRLTLAQRQVLREPRYVTRADESYVGAAAVRESAPRAVLSDRDGRVELCFDADLMRGVDEEAEAALCALRDATAECRLAVTLRAGDLLVVDNTAAVHGRTPFTPRFDGTDRWLQRSFVLSELPGQTRIVGTVFLP